MRVVGGRWKLAILLKLYDRTHRFAELQRALPGVTARVLTRQLRELESDGLISRRVYPEIPPRVEYSPSRVGKTLESLVRELERWGNWYVENSTREVQQPG